MKIIITKEFTNVDEALCFLGAAESEALGFFAAQAVDKGSMLVGADPATAPAGTPQSTPPKKPRKPRSDAGQARGPYKTGAVDGSPAGGIPGAQASAAPATNAKPEGAGATATTPGSAPASQAVLSGAASPSAAPEKSTLPDSKSAGSGVADLTLDTVRATLGLLHKLPGKGTEACIASLKQFGVLRISDLPREKYAEFDGYVRAQLSKAA